MTADGQELNRGDTAYDVDGRPGKVISSYRRGKGSSREWWVIVEYENGGTRDAPEACFRKEPYENTTG